MTIDEQFDIYLKEISTRKRAPAKGATIAAYQSYYRCWIQPQLGKLDLSAVENGVMRRFVATLAEAELSPSSIASITNCVKGIIGSAVDDNGNELYPRKWNSTWIDAPPVEDQNAPTMTREALQEAISRTQGQFQVLCVLLAGTGLRINEALSLKTNDLTSSSWEPKASKLVIRKALWRGMEQTPKTQAGKREVDLSPELNNYLEKQKTNDGFLFAGGMNQPLRIRTIYDLAKKAGIPGFHSFRRYRVTHLENAGVPRTLVQFWIGHSEKGITDRYCRLDREIETRKEWATKAGLGFTL